MRLEAGLHQRQILSHRMAPQVIQALELLHLPILSLEESLKQELVDNPALELSDDSPEPDEAPTASDEAETSDTQDRLEALRAFETQWQEGAFRGDSGGDTEEDKKYELLQNAPGRQRSLADYLIEQLRPLDLNERTRRVAEHLIFNLDANGYLPCGIDEIVVSLPDLFADKTAEAAANEVEAVLRIVQSFDPPGVAARDTRECLLLQLRPYDPAYDLKHRILAEHYHDILENRIPHIAKTLELPLERCQALIAELQTLRPKPASTFFSAAAPAIVPDVVVREVDGEYEVILEEGSLPPLHINPAYVEMLQNKTVTGAEKEYILRKVEAARRLVAAIEQRRLTITRISREVVRAQRAFLDDGVDHLKPMKMQQIASTVGVHVSTVSRAIADKYIQTPRGIFPFKFFFAGGADTSAGESEAKVNVMERLRLLVAGEDPRNPLSDLDIVRLMGQKFHLDLARRTVTKYRKVLRIPSSRRRKRF